MVNKEEAAIPNIQEFDAGNVAFRANETGVSAREGAARRIGSEFNAQAGAVEMLARETERLGSQTRALGGEVEHVGSTRASQTADTGRRVGSAIIDAGDAAIKILDARQISHGSATFAAITAQTTQRWNETVKNADPNDPSVAQKFMANLDEQLGKFKEDGFYTENGQKWAQAHADALRQHMQEATVADMSTQAGQAAVVNQRQTVNQLSATVHSDPASLDFSLAALASSTEGIIASSPNLKAEHVGRLRTELNQAGAESIIKSAAIGYIEKTAQVPPWLSDAKYSAFVNGSEMKLLESQARTRAKANELTDKAIQKAQREETGLKATGEISKIWTDGVKYGPDDKAMVSPGVINKLLDVERTYPGAATNEIKSMIGVIQKEIDERADAPKAVSAAQTNELLSRIRADDDTRLTTNDEIYKAKIAGRLTNTDFRFLMDEFKNVRTPQGEAFGKRQEDFISAVKPYIVTSDPMGKMDPSQSEQLYRFRLDLSEKIAEYRKAGKDPRDLMTPGKPDYMGGPAALVPYQKPMTEVLGNFTKRLTRGANLTGDGSEVTGMQTLEIPAGMSPSDAMKWAKEQGAKPGQKVRLPDGRDGTVR